MSSGGMAGNASTYEDHHRLFLQSFVADPCQSEETAKRNYAIAYSEMDGTSNDEKIDDVIKTINDRLKRRTFYTIRHRKCEVTGEKKYVLLNTSDCSWTRNVTPYNEKEQVLFSKIMEAILRSGNGYVSSITVLNMGSSFKPILNQTMVEKILQKFVCDHWFVNQGGRVYISARSAVELESTLSGKYEIAKCTLCKDALYCGVQCGKCSERCHRYCLSHYFVLREGLRVCPSCHEDWSDNSSDESSNN